MTRGVAVAIMLAAVSCMLGCSPNLVVGSREVDAAAIDAAQPAPQTDAGRPDAARPARPSSDASRDAASSEQQDADIRASRDAAAGCSTDDECAGSDEPRCKLSESRCVECLGDGDCERDELCELDGECSARPIPCTGPLQCASSDDPICHPTLQVCVECTTDDHCPRDETCQPNNECD